jgi:pimeloyl-ACP methyl ester carboxylesterase
MMKWVKMTAVLLVLALALVIYRAWTPDIPRAVLADKYAGGASDFIELPSGARAHFRMQGNAEGPTLVLLHGSNASLHTWQGWVDALEADHFIVTVDLPGHGLTGGTPADDYTYDGMVAFVKELADTLNLSGFILGGNSMGGAVTLSYALAHPGDLRAIILVDAAGVSAPEETKVKTDRPLAFDLAGRWYTDWILENITPRAFVREGLEKSVGDTGMITDAMIDRYWELGRHPGNRRATGKRFAWYRDKRASLPVEDITLPTLILWGEEDRLVPLEGGVLVRERIKGSVTNSYPNVGHIPMEEIPAITATAVRSFIAGLATK